MIRWPGVVKPGTEINDIFSHEDWLPTFVAAAGEPDIKEKLLTGYEAIGKTFKVHLDGYDQRDLLAGTGPGKRKEYFYWTDDGNLCGLRYEQWKIVFMEQRAHGLDVWQDPLITLRFPQAFQYPSRPLRAGRQRCGRLRSVACRTCLRARSGAGFRGPAPEDLRRFSAPAEARQLLTQRGAGESFSPPAAQACGEAVPNGLKSITVAPSRVAARPRGAGNRSMAVVNDSASRQTIAQRARNELREYALLSAYLFVCFGALILQGGGTWRVGYQLSAIRVGGHQGADPGEVHNARPHDRFAGPRRRQLPGN